MAENSSQSKLSALAVRGLHKAVGNFVLRADFDLRMGERAALIGRSGSGKTTLLRLIAGLEKPDQGEVFFEGDGRSEKWSAIAPHRREVGFVFQDQALFPALNVLENVTFGLRMRGWGRQERAAEGFRWLERVGLLSKADSPIDQLSGGEAQRVALVRALIWKPRVLLLDEPFTGLDPALRCQLRGELFELHRSWPVPMLLVSHDPEDQKALATVRLELRENEDSKVRMVCRCE